MNIIDIGRFTLCLGLQFNVAVVGLPTHIKVTSIQCVCDAHVLEIFLQCIYIYNIPRLYSKRIVKSELALTSNTIFFCDHHTSISLRNMEVKTLDKICDYLHKNVLAIGSIERVFLSFTRNFTLTGCLTFHLL